MKTLEDINKFLQLTEVDNTGATTPPDDKKSLKTGEITTDQIVDKLNTIRSGKSFKDSQIKSSLEEYINSLKKPEKLLYLHF